MLKNSFQFVLKKRNYQRFIYPADKSGMISLSTAWLSLCRKKTYLPYTLVIIIQIDSVVMYEMNVSRVILLLLLPNIASPLKTLKKRLSLSLINNCLMVEVKEILSSLIGSLRDGYAKCSGGPQQIQNRSKTFLFFGQRSFERKITHTSMINIVKQRILNNKTWRFLCC